MILKKIICKGNSISFEDFESAKIAEDNMIYNLEGFYNFIFGRKYFFCLSNNMGLILNSFMLCLLMALY